MAANLREWLRLQDTDLIPTWEDYPKKGRTHSEGSFMPLHIVNSLCDIAYGKNSIKVKEELYEHTKMWRAMKTHAGHELLVFDPKPLELNQDFAYLLGLLITGGYIAERKLIYTLRIEHRNKAGPRFGELREWTAKSLSSSLSGSFGEVHSFLNNISAKDKATKQTLIIPQFLTRTILRFFDKYEHLNPESFFGKGRKSVPQFIRDASKEVKKGFLKAVFDDSAYVKPNTKTIIVSNNEDYLHEILYLLKSLGFNSKDKPITINKGRTKGAAMMRIPPKYSRKLILRILSPIEQRHPIFRDQLEELWKNVKTKKDPKIV